MRLEPPRGPGCDRPREDSRAPSRHGPVPRFPCARGPSVTDPAPTARPCRVRSGTPTDRPAGGTPSITHSSPAPHGHTRVSGDQPAVRIHHQPQRPERIAESLLECPRRCHDDPGGRMDGTHRPPERNAVPFYDQEGAMNRSEAARAFQPRGSPRHPLQLSGITSQSSTGRPSSGPDGIP